MVRNFKCIIILIGFFIYSNIGISQTNAEKGILWEISGNKLKEPSYLYGTIHIKDKRVFGFDTVVINALKQCKQYMPEMDLDEGNSMDMMKAFYMQDSNSLDKLLSTEDYELVKKTVRKNLGMGIKPYKKMKPFFLMAMLTNDLFNQDEDDFLDSYLLSLAQKEGKIITGLETFEDQMSCVDRVSLKEQCRWLMMTIKDTVKQVEQSEEMIDIYLSGNLSAYASLDSGAYGKDFFDIFLTERNIKMADKIDSDIKNNSSFIAIGAMHLIGDEGLVNLLRKKGYEVKPILFDFAK